MQYLEKVDAFFLLDDLAFAREFAHTLGDDFEIVRITRGEIFEGVHFLGYDVSSGVNLSYLAGGLKFCTGEGERLGLMLCLLEQHFQSLLNHHGLFADASTAHFFLQCVREINQLSPNDFDPTETYEVLAISQVAKNSLTNFWGK